MYFIVLATDRPGMLDKRIEHRQRHIDYWLGMPGTVKVAGAMLSDDSDTATPQGSSFLIEAENGAAARALVADDPFMREGIFDDDIRIIPIRPAIGAWKPD